MRAETKRTISRYQVPSLRVDIQVYQLVQEFSGSFVCGEVV